MSNIFGSYQQSAAILDKLIEQYKAWQEASVPSGMLDKSQNMIDALEHAKREILAQEDREEKIFSDTYTFHNFVNEEDNGE